MKSLSALAVVAGLAAAVFAAQPAAAQSAPPRCKPESLPSLRPAPRPPASATDPASQALLKAQEFMAQNAKKPGVISLPSGAQYKVISSGDKDAACANPELRIRIHYEGRLPDGKVFDSSLDGAPAVFSLGTLIPGWQQVVPFMRIGDEWEVYLPPNLGYGVRGRGEEIPPNSPLIFKLKLLGMLG